MGFFSDRTKRINREMLALATPNILSNISLPLLGTVDTVLMGRLSDVHIAAVGIAAMIFNFLYWNFGFLRMATTGFTAQFVGKADVTGQVMQLGRAGMLAFSFAMILLFFQTTVGETSFVLMNVEGDLLPLVREYFYIRIWDVPATLGLLVMMGWFFGMQNSIAPLYLTLFVNTVNIALSFYFVRVLGWGADGVATGTLIAQYLGLFLGVGLIFYYYRTMFVHFKLNLLRQFSNWLFFMRVNSDIFLRTLALTLVFAFFYAKSAEMGALVLAVNVILMHFVNWMSYGIDGFAYATESLVGKYKGRESEKDLDRTLELAFAWAGFLAILCALVYWLFGPALLRVFTDVDEVLLAAKPYLIIVAVLPLLGFWSYVWDGIFIGLTASVSMRNAMIISFICFFACWYLIADQSSNYWLWYCLMLFLVLRAVIQYGFFRRYKYSLR
ncbi:MAG: MATE family efflux transporter [Saprospirales bacterium]|nr:MAG: MATE family efflux transporter [Saprospirales bacterium]